MNQLSTRKQASGIWRNVRLVTLGESVDGLDVIEDAAVAVVDGRIVYAGAERDLPADFARSLEATDCKGRVMTPALIDCHTHLVHGGNRAREFQMRLEGATYEEIARAGGGIVSSVKATNALTVDQLVESALPRLDTLLSEGVSTVEIKSGYGLNVAAELNMLRAARKLETLRPVRIVTSYLAAHATPADYKGRNGDYISDVVLPGLDAAHAEGLVDAVDGFCEGIAFSTAEIARVFDRARALGLPVKLHAEQLSNLGGAKLAASYGALSADHLEYLDAEGAAALAKAGPSRCCCLAPSMHCAKSACRRCRRCATPARLSQSLPTATRHLAADLVAPHHEYVGDLLPADGCRVPCRCDARSRTRPRPAH